MAPRQIIAKHYQRILASWPVDKLRPEVSFQKAIQRRIDTRVEVSKAPSANNIEANEAQVSVPATKPFDEKRELGEVNALHSFLENRYSKKYPISDAMLKPASKPTHYEDLVRELEEAPKRSWLQAKIVKLKSFMRIK